MRHLPRLFTLFKLPHRLSNRASDGIPSNSVQTNFLDSSSLFVAQATPTNVDYQKIESAAKQDKSENFGLDLGNHPSQLRSVT
jgi:hypothetical protein